MKVKTKANNALVDFHNYKGIYFSNQLVRWELDSLAGAHFKYTDMWLKLQRLAALRRSQERWNTSLLQPAWSREASTQYWQSEVRREQIMSKIKSKNSSAESLIKWNKSFHQNLQDLEISIIRHHRCSQAFRQCLNQHKHKDPSPHNILKILQSQADKSAAKRNKLWNNFSKMKIVNNTMQDSLEKRDRLKNLNLIDREIASKNNYKMLNIAESRK